METTNEKYRFLLHVSILISMYENNQNFELVIENLDNLENAIILSVCILL